MCIRDSITTYRVNGGAETDSATITMGDAVSNVVELSLIHIYFVKV